MRDYQKEHENRAARVRYNIRMRRLGMVLITFVFLAEICIISRFAQIMELNALWYVLLSFATFRMARTISFNEIGEPFRAPFTYVQKDSCGAGDNVHPRQNNNFLYVIGSLLVCPICSGTHSAVILMGILHFFPVYGQVLISVLAVAGVSELLHWGAENQEWHARMARCIAGLISPDKE